MISEPGEYERGGDVWMWISRGEVEKCVQGSRWWLGVIFVASCGPGRTSEDAGRARRWRSRDAKGLSIKEVTRLDVTWLI